jgi:DNA-binding CsgD family transcriptional regulator
MTRDGKCAGVIGSFIDITGQQLVKKSGHYDPETKRYYCGKELGDIHLSGREIEVFKKMILGHSARQIGEDLNISTKTSESHIEIIKYKLQAKTKSDVIEMAIKYGLTHILYLHQPE